LTCADATTLSSHSLPHVLLSLVLFVDCKKKG
jgi:hypothetical protein